MSYPSSSSSCSWLSPRKNYSVFIYLLDLSVTDFVRCRNRLGQTEMYTVSMNTQNKTHFVGGCGGRWSINPRARCIVLFNFIGSHSFRHWYMHSTYRFGLKVHTPFPLAYTFWANLNFLKYVFAIALWLKIFSIIDLLVVFCSQRIDFSFSLLSYTLVWSHLQSLIMHKCLSNIVTSFKILCWFQELVTKDGIPLANITPSIFIIKTNISTKKYVLLINTSSYFAMLGNVVQYD